MCDVSAQIKSYLDHCKNQKKLSGKSLKAYAIDLKQFLTFTSGEAYSYSKASILSYITYIHKTYKPRTAKRKLASLKAFLNYLQYEDILESNPLHRIQTKFQEPQVLPRTIPLSTIEKLLYVAYGELESASTMYAQQTALRNAAILELLFATGMRVSELCSLDAADVDLNDGNILIMGKGSKERVLQIGNRQVLTILARYEKVFAARIADKGCFFMSRVGARISEQSVRFMIKRLCEIAGVTAHITPHMFRHTFATLLLEEDVDIRYIQNMLGHSSIRTTQIYTHITAKKQRTILEAKHPRNNICGNLEKKIEISDAV